MKLFIRVFYSFFFLLLAACNSEKDGAPTTPKINNDIVSIQLTVEKKDIPIGVKQKITAIASFSDNRKEDITGSVDWQYSVDDVIRIAKDGTLIGLKAAETITIHAKKSGILSQNIEITITDAVIESINVISENPSFIVGESTQLRAYGTYSDGIKYEITNSVDWHATPEDTASINRLGILSAHKEGDIIVTANKDSVTQELALNIMEVSIDKIEIKPLHDSAIVMIVNDVLSLNAIATYNNGTERNVTSSADWSIKSGDSVTLNQGVLTAIHEGSSVVLVQKDGVEASVTIDVNNAELVEINIQASQYHITKNQALTLAVTKKYSDGSEVISSEHVVWTSSDPDVALVNANGMLQGVGVGKVEITGTINDISHSITINVYDVSYTLEELNLQDSSHSTDNNVYPDNGMIYSNGIIAIKISEGKVEVIDIIGGRDVVSTVYKNTHQNDVYGFSSVVQYVELDEFDNESVNTHYFLSKKNDFNKETSTEHEYIGDYGWSRTENVNVNGNYKININLKNSTCSISDNHAIRYVCEVDENSFEKEKGIFTSIVKDRNNYYYGVVKAYISGDNNEFITGIVYDKNNTSDNNNSVDIFTAKKV